MDGSAEITGTRRYFGGTKEASSAVLFSQLTLDHSFYVLGNNYFTIVLNNKLILYFYLFAHYFGQEG